MANSTEVLPNPYYDRDGALSTLTRDDLSYREAELFDRLVAEQRSFATLGEGALGMAVALAAIVDVELDVLLSAVVEEATSRAA